MMRKILSMLLALTMILSLFSVNVFAADEVDTSKMDVAFEWTGKTKANVQDTMENILGADDFAKFIEAMNIEGAYFEISGNNNCSQHGAMVNLFVNQADQWWTSTAYGMGYPTNDFKKGGLVSEMVTTCKTELPITTAFLQLGIYEHEKGHDPYVADDWAVVATSIKVYVPKGTAPEPDPEPEGVLVTLIKDGKSVAGGDFSGPKIGWGTKIIDNTSAEWADFVKAVNNKDAKFVLKYTVTGEVANEEYGWWNILQVDTPKGGLGHITIANHSGEAAKFVDTLDGKVMSDQWSLLHIGEHVVTYSTADFANLLATHECTTKDEKEPDNPDKNFTHVAGDTAVEKITALFSQSGLADTLSVSVSSLVIEGPSGTTEPEDKPDTNTSILLDIGPNVYALSKSEAIDISKSGTYTLKATAGTMDGNSDDTFIGLKSDKEDKSTELPDGTTITLKSVKLGDTAVTVTKGEETYTVKDGKLDFVLKLIAFDTNTNIFEGTLPSEFTTVEVTFVVNNPDDPLEPEVHEHTFDETKWEHDDTTHWHECTAEDCDKSEGYKTEPEKHTLDYVVNKEDATKHDVTCTVCKAVIETVAHTYEDGACTLCKAEHDHTGEEIKYTDNENGTHKVEYTVCKLVKEAEDCTYDATTGKCTKCGAAKPAEEEECDHVGTERTYKVNEKDATKHDVICAKCKTVIETVAHTYENGVCTACEAKHDHTDEKVTYVDNKDGTHTATYADCGLVETAKHTYKDGVCTLCESKHDHADEKVSYVDNKDGTHTATYADCGLVETAKHTYKDGVCTLCESEHDHADEKVSYVDNKDGTHKATYADCGLTVEEKCTYDEKTGKCVCGAEKKVEVSTECKEEHKGWTIVDVSSYKDKSGEFNIPITGNVKAGDTLTVHIIGYATTAGRFYVANDEGGDHDLSGGRANVIDEKVKLDANGVFDYTTEPFTLYAPKSGSIVATRFIFKDSKALTITHFAYLVEHPESEPKGYEEDEALTNATVEAEDDSVVITPDGELKTEGLLVTFDGEGAPAAGTVVVNYVAENGKETKVLDNPDGDAEIISDCKAPNDFFGKGGFWGRAAANALDLTIDEIKALFEVDGAAFTFVYSGTPDGYYGGVPKVNLNGKFDNAALCKLTTLSDGKIQATVKLADVLKASGVEVKDIENFLVQTCVQNFKIYSASFTVPGVASTAPVEFKAGKKYVEVPTDKNKTITSVVVSYEGAEAADIASVKISSGKKTEDVSSKITLNGNAIRLGEDHHGFLYMGHIITLPHTFGDDNVCTICGYKRIVIEPTSKQIETEVKINDDTVNKLDKEVTVADGTAACSDDQFSILLPRAYSIGDEVKIHIKGSSDGDFRIWAADGGTTMSPEPLWKASENGFTSGNFDLEITLTIGDKDNSGKETANAVLFKGPSYGVKLSNFKLTYFAYYVEEEGDYKTSSNALYSLTTTGGQNFENKNLAGGLELETNDGRTRLATSWVGEGKVYDAMVNAFKANPEAVIKITYTGTITAFGIESENAGILDVANEVTEGQKYTVMTVKVADVLDTCKDAIADSSWRNIYVVAEDGAVLYGFEVVPA